MFIFIKRVLHLSIPEIQVHQGKVSKLYNGARNLMTDGKTSPASRRTVEDVASVIRSVVLVGDIF